MAQDDGPLNESPAVQRIRLRPGELTIASEREGDIHVIALAGELDLATADQVEQELLRVEATDAGSIVLDLSRLRFIDSTGMRVIIAAEARSRRDSSRLALLRGPDAVQRVFELTGVVDLMPFSD